MASPYSSLGRGNYTNADVMEELQQSGGYTSARTSARAGASQVFNYSSYGANQFQPQDAYGGFPTGNLPPGFHGGQAVASAVFDAIDKNHDGKLTREEFQSAFKGGAYTSAMQSTSAGGAYFSGQQTSAAMESLYQGAVDVIYGERHVVNERMVEQRQQIISGVRPIYTFEKVVEVPQVIVKEYEREVLKPQLIERIVEVPRTETKERYVVGPPTVQYQEQIVEVPQIVIEERVVHVPRKELQERLIEIPKVQYVERVEYDDFVEYREVVVDKIVEVPEIEYHVREVEHLVPQTYIQEYFIDKYVEVPVTQIQEVAREERVPFAGQGITVAVPKGIFGPPRTAVDGGSMFSMVDRNRDGIISAEEAQHGVSAALAARSQAFGLQMVQPQSSRSRQGITVAVPRGAFGPPRTAVDGGEMFNMMDRNRDGTITPEEAQYAVSAMVQDRPALYGSQVYSPQAPSYARNSPFQTGPLPAQQPHADFDPNRASSNVGNSFSSSIPISAAFNPFVSARSKMDKSQMMSDISSAPMGTTFAVPKGTFTSGQQMSTIPRSMSTSPGYGPMPAAPAVPGYMSMGAMTPPTPPVPYCQTMTTEYNPRTSVAAY